MRAATIMVAIGELEELPLRLEAHQVLLSSKPPSLQGSDLGTAECAERSAAPRCGVLDHPQSSVSSTSCLHLQAFPSLQFFASIIVSNFLHRFWLSWKSSFPLHYPPHGLRIPPGPSDPTLFYVFLCFFAFVFFAVFSACFFIHFWCFWARLGIPKSSQNL